MILISAIARAVTTLAFVVLWYNVQIKNVGADMYAEQLRQYVGQVLARPSVQQFIAQYNISNKPNIPYVTIVPSCGALYAAQTYGHILIEVSSWLLVDKKQTASVLRHECAHLDHHLCGLTGPTHGPEFTRVLQYICEDTWEEDKFWHPNDIIEKSRQKFHPEFNLMRCY